MIDHVPECRYVVFQQQGQIPEAVIPMRCICDRLRACEQRVREEERALIAVEQTTLAELNAEYRKGLDAGVQAARDAVAAMQGDTPHSLPRWVKRDALDAIDALRGVS